MNSNGNTKPPRSTVPPKNAPSLNINLSPLNVVSGTKLEKESMNRKFKLTAFPLPQTTHGQAFQNTGARPRACLRPGRGEATGCIYMPTIGQLISPSSSGKSLKIQF